jgi:TetR/AcrR family transcriptional repressor of nem operon
MNEQCEPRRERRRRRIGRAGMARGRAALLRATAGLDVRLAIVSFSGRYQPTPGQKLKHIVHDSEAVIRSDLSDDIGALQRALRQVLAREGNRDTHFTAGMKRSIETLSAARAPSRSARKGVFFISDSATPIVIGGDENLRRLDQRMQEAAYAALDARIAFDTFAAGSASESEPPDVLSRIAGATGGTFHAVPDPVDLSCRLIASGSLARPRLGSVISRQYAFRMPAGRPKSFDETEVLSRAMDLFWQCGYARLSVSELLAHMEISRQSLYDSFGSKRGLFLRAIHHYRDTQLTTALALLERDGSPLENVKALMRYFENLANDRRCRGCLVANTLVELGPHDPEIAQLLQATLDLLQASLHGALRSAQERGELPSTKSPREISRALLNALIGLAVAGKLQHGPETYRDIYSGTLSMLD